MIYKRQGHWHLDVTINGVRYREALDTTDKREAKEREKDRIAAIKQGRGASKSGREFARKPFSEAATTYLEERKPHVAERTMQFENERLVPLRKHFGEKPLLRLKAEDVARYQTARLQAGISGRTINMETGVLRRMLKRAKVWSALCEDVKALPERHGIIGRALPSNLKQNLFEVAASRPNGWSLIVPQFSLFRLPAVASNLRTFAGKMWICSLVSQQLSAVRPTQATERFHLTAMPWRPYPGCWNEHGNWEATTRPTSFFRHAKLEHRSNASAKKLAHCMAKTCSRSRACRGKGGSEGSPGVRPRIPGRRRGMETCSGSVQWLTVPRSPASSNYRTRGSGRIGRYPNGSSRAYVAGDA